MDKWNYGADISRHIESMSLLFPITQRKKVQLKRKWFRSNQKRIQSNHFLSTNACGQCEVQLWCENSSTSTESAKSL